MAAVQPTRPLADASPPAADCDGTSAAGGLLTDAVASTSNADMNDDEIDVQSSSGSPERNSPTECGAFKAEALVGLPGLEDFLRSLNAAWTAAAADAVTKSPANLTTPSRRRRLQNATSKRPIHIVEQREASTFQVTGEHTGNQPADDQTAALLGALHMDATTAPDLFGLYASIMDLARLSADAPAPPPPQKWPATTASQLTLMLAALAATGVQDNQFNALIGASSGASVTDPPMTSLPVNEREIICKKNLLQAMITGMNWSSGVSDESSRTSYTRHRVQYSISSASSSALSSPTADSAASSSLIGVKEAPLSQSTTSCQSVDSGYGRVAGSVSADVALALLEALANTTTAPAALALLASDVQIQSAFMDYLNGQTPVQPPTVSEPTNEPIDCSGIKVTEEMMQEALAQALKSSNQIHLDLNEIVKLQELNHAGRTDKVTAEFSAPARFTSAPGRRLIHFHSTSRRPASSAEKLVYGCEHDENYGVLSFNRHTNAEPTNNDTIKSSHSPPLALARKRPRTTSKGGGAPSAPSFTGVVGASGGSPVLKNVLAAAASSIKNVSNVLSSVKLGVDGNRDESTAAAAAAALAGGAIGCTGAEFLELSELEEFANFFKKQRIKHGFTQGDVGLALGKRYGTDFSQTTISRFEALNLSYKNMCKLRPLLREWLEEAELMIENGATVVDILEAPTPNFAALAASSTQNGAHSFSSSDGNPKDWATDGAAIGGTDGEPLRTLLAPRLIGSSIIQPLKRRRKRTNLDNAQKAALDIHFGADPRPDHQRMNEIAALLELDPDVVRVWFCNRRQKLRKVC